MRVAVVLGAGGVAGWAFHLGVVTALGEAGLDPGTSQVVVGTSAGATVGAAALAGPGAVERLGVALDQPPTSEERRAYLAEVRAASHRRSWGPSAPALTRRALAGDVDPLLGLVGLLPDGWFPTDRLEDLPGVGDHDGWPDRLRVPAVRLRDGARVVFGRDVLSVKVPAAVAAGSAVPVLFRPRAIDGERYIDAAVLSSTHADLALDAAPLDLAIISAPMLRSTRGLLGGRFLRALRDERRLLREHGVRSIVLVPESEAQRAAMRDVARRRAGAARVVTERARRLTASTLERHAEWAD